MRIWEVILLSLLSTVISKAKDFPCNAVQKEKEFGYVCVCNSTYCDTVERPRKLEEREFHVYVTSNTRPGFNHYNGFFRMQAFTPHGLRLKINVNKTRQTINGFGSSFTDSFGHVFNKLSAGTQNNFLKSHFSPDGIEYSLCRVVFGSSDFSLREYTYAPNYDPMLKSFNLTKEDYVNKIWPIQRANNYSKRYIKLLGSTWSPPGWMKRNNSTSTGYLLPKFRQTWAEYHLRTLDSFKKENVSFWGLTTGNEPVTLLGARGVSIPNLAMFPEEQALWIGENLGPVLEKAGYKNVSIILLDDQRKYASWWMDTVMRVKKARKYVTGIGLHWYMDYETSPSLLDKVKQNYPKQDIYYTESSINPIVRGFLPVSPAYGSWRRASLYISSIMENLFHWVSGYIDWNMALNADGGPNMINFTCDSPVIINETADEFYKQPMFYAMGHFSKFLQPGAILVEVNLMEAEIYEEITTQQTTQPAITTDPPIVFPPSFTFEDVQYIGAINPDGSYTVIIYNPKTVNVDVSVYCPTKGYAFLELEPQSISTLLY